MPGPTRGRSLPALIGGLLPVTVPPAAATAPEEDVAPAGSGLARLLLIHHSCGGEPGSGERCIHAGHPDGGGLHTLPEARGDAVDEASCGSSLGEGPDIRDRQAGCRDEAERILPARRHGADAAHLSLPPYRREHPAVPCAAFAAPPLAERKPVGVEQQVQATFHGWPKRPQPVAGHPGSGGRREATGVSVAFLEQVRGAPAGAGF